MSSRCRHTSATKECCLICAVKRRRLEERRAAAHKRWLRQQAEAQGPKSLLDTLSVERVRRATTIAARLELAREVLDAGLAEGRSASWPVAS